MDLEAIKNLSARQKVSRWIEKLSRQISERLMDQIVLTSIEKRRKIGSIEENLLRICREAIMLKENRFFKKKKKTER